MIQVVFIEKVGGGKSRLIGEYPSEAFGELLPGTRINAQDGAYEVSGDDLRINIIEHTKCAVPSAIVQIFVEKAA